jgi:hypothetical protein
VTKDQGPSLLPAYKLVPSESSDPGEPYATNAVAYRSGKRYQQPPVPELPCCTVQCCVGVQRAKQGEGCPACPSRPKEER